MDDRGSLLDTQSWNPSRPLTVVIAERDVAEFAGLLCEDLHGWKWHGRMSVNGIHIDVRAGFDWSEDRDAGWAWFNMYFTGYNLACNLRRDAARDVAAGLTGESSVTVPVFFNCEPEDEDWLPNPVTVYFQAERSQHVLREDATVRVTNVVEVEYRN